MSSFTDAQAAKLVADIHRIANYLEKIASRSESKTPDYDKAYTEYRTRADEGRLK